MSLIPSGEGWKPEFPKENTGLDFELDLLSKIDIGNIDDVRKFIEDSFWQGDIGKNTSNLPLINTALKADYEMLKLLKNYCAPLDDMAIQFIKDKSKNKDDLVRIQKALRKAGIFKISQWQKEFEIKISTKPDNKLKQGEISQIWIDILQGFEKNGLSKGYLTGRHVTACYEGIGIEDTSEPRYLLSSCENQNVKIAKTLLEQGARSISVNKSHIFNLKLESDVNSYAFEVYVVKAFLNDKWHRMILNISPINIGKLSLDEVLDKLEADNSQVAFDGDKFITTENYKKSIQKSLDIRDIKKKMNRDKARSSAMRRGITYRDITRFLNRKY
jgi:hypothetical protein